MAFQRTRPDFSNALVHLTRGTRDDDGFPVRAPFDVLKKILSDGLIRGSGNDGFVKGSRNAVCLSEVPLSGVRYLVDDRKERYTYYGLMISKRQAFEKGGRPVIYLPDLEGTWIPDNERWRHVRFEHGSVDFTHEREWRIPGDLHLAELSGLYVLVWSADEKQEIERRFGAKLNIRGCLIMEDFATVL